MISYLNTWKFTLEFSDDLIHYSAFSAAKAM